MYKIATNTPNGVQYCKPVTRTRNLIPFPYKNSSGHIYEPGKTYVNKGVSFYINSDGSIVANGTNTESSPAWFRISYLINIPPDSTIGLSGCPVDKSLAYVYFYAGDAENNNVAEYDSRAFNNETTFFTLPETGEIVGGIIYITVRPRVTLNNVLFKPMLYIGDTALPFEPYIQRYNIHIKENLINVDEMLNECLVKNEDGSYTIRKTEQNRFSKYYYITLPPGKYKLGADILENTSVIPRVQLNTNIGSFGIDIKRPFRDILLTKTVSWITVYIDSRDVVGTYTTFKNLRLYKLA